MPRATWTPPTLSAEANRAASLANGAGIALDRGTPDPSCLVSLVAAARAVRGSRLAASATDQGNGPAVVEGDPLSACKGFWGWSPLGTPKGSRGVGAGTPDPQAKGRVLQLSPPPRPRAGPAWAVLRVPRQIPLL